MAIFDWVVLGCLALGAVWGYSRGLIAELSGLASLLAGFLCVKFFKENVIGYLNSVEQLSDYVFFVPLVASMALFVFGFLSMKLLAFVFKKLIHQTPLKHVDRVGGLALGFTKWFICILIFIYVAVEFKIPKVFEWVNSSQSGLYLRDAARAFATIVL